MQSLQYWLRPKGSVSLAADHDAFLELQRTEAASIGLVWPPPRRAPSRQQLWHQLLYEELRAGRGLPALATADPPAGWQRGIPLSEAWLLESELQAIARAAPLQPLRMLLARMALESHLTRDG